MTKKICFILFAGLLSVCVMAQNKKAPFVLRGVIENYDGQVIYLNYGSMYDAIEYIDSAEVVDGKFEFRGEIDQAYAAQLGMEPRPDTRTKMIRFYIDPNEMTLTADWNDVENYILKGARTDDEMKQISVLLMPMRKRIMDLRAKLQELISDEEKAVVEKEIDSLTHEHLRQEVKFIEQTPSSYIAAMLLRSIKIHIEIQEVKRLYEALDEDVKNGIDGKDLGKSIAIWEGVQPGQPAPEISSTDINGKDFKLSDLKGKYVILDFWASWCVPCRESNPKLVELWNKYHERGLEIVCVADNDQSPDKWRDAVKKDGIGMFHHLLRGLKQPRLGVIDRSSDISEAYDVHFLPTKYLIDKDGNIVGKMDTEEIIRELERIYSSKE